MTRLVEAPFARTRLAIAVLLAVLAAYGAFSTPTLAARWGASLPGAALAAAWLAAAALALPLLRARPSPRLLLALGLVALGARAGVAMLFAHRMPAGDAHSYLELATGLLAGEGLAIYEPYIGSTLYAFYPPAYPLLLAGWVSVAGASIVSLSLLNLVVDGAAAAMLLRLASALGRPGAGRAAAWLYLLWPSVLLSAPLAQKEGFCILLILGLAVAWLRALEAPGWRTAALIGVLAGVLALAQPGQAPLGGLFGLALIPLASTRRVLASGLRAVPFAVAILLPWWLRNWLVFGAFVPLTSAGAISLWVGNNPDATGNWLPTPPSLKGLPELGYARAAGALATAWIAEHPAAFVRLTATKFVRACALGQSGIVRLAAATPLADRAATALLLPLAQGSHLLLLATSAWSARRRSVPPALILLLAAAGLQLAIFGVWFEFSERHCAFVVPFLILSALCAWRAEPGV